MDPAIPLNERVSLIAGGLPASTGQGAVEKALCRLSSLAVISAVLPPRSALCLEASNGLVGRPHTPLADLTNKNTDSEQGQELPTPPWIPRAVPRLHDQCITGSLYR